MAKSDSMRGGSRRRLVIMSLAGTLIGAAIGIGAVHTAAPDHWVPFAALARARRWSAGRTALVTAVCGLGHVSVSAALGVLALICGRELFEVLGHRLASVAGLLLIGFGVSYALWGLRTAQRIHAHGQSHVHAHTPLMLFVLFSADPCVAVIPLVFASAPLGWSGTLAVVLAYEIATIATMVLLVVPTWAMLGSIRGSWADRWGDACAGAIFAIVGLAVISLGV